MTPEQQSEKTLRCTRIDISYLRVSDYTQATDLMLKRLVQVVIQEFSVVIFHSF
jgi:hypothetical protein